MKRLCAVGGLNAWFKTVIDVAAMHTPDPCGMTGPTGCAVVKRLCAVWVSMNDRVNN